MLCSRLFVLYFMACLFAAASAISPCIMCSWPFIKNTTRCQICNAIKAGKNLYENAQRLKKMVPWADVEGLISQIRKSKNSNSSKRRPAQKKNKKKCKAKTSKGCKRH